MIRIRFIKDAAGYKNNTAHTLDDITARVLMHRGYAKQEDAPPSPEEEPIVTPPAAPRAAAPKKPAASKPKVTKAPANRAMTAKKDTGTARRAPKKNEYETKGSHAKDADE